MKKDEKKEEKKEFTAADIQVLPVLMAVRIRPHVWVDTVDVQGLYQLVGRLVHSNISANFTSQWTKLEITINSDNSLSLADNGQGPSLQPINHSELERFMQNLFAGSWNEKIYQEIGYLADWGAVVNALSEWTKIELKVDGVLYQFKCAQGLTAEPFQLIGPAGQNGTTLHFKPDPQIWGEMQVVAAELEAVLQPLVLPPYQLTRPDDYCLLITKN